MLIVEDKALLDVDNIAGVRRIQDDPAWWKKHATPEKPLGERLDARVDAEERREKKKQRRRR